MPWGPHAALSIKSSNHFMTISCILGLCFLKIARFQCTVRHGENPRVCEFGASAVTLCLCFLGFMMGRQRYRVIEPKSVSLVETVPRLLSGYNVA